jgi:hypothetical protein
MFGVGSTFHVVPVSRTMNIKASRENKMSNYGEGILAAGKARVRRISEAICNERATPPADKRTSQSCSSYFFAMPSSAELESQKHERTIY